LNGAKWRLASGAGAFGRSVWLIALFCCSFSAFGWAIGLQKLHNDAVPVVAGMKPLGRLDGSKKLELAISLPLRNADQLASFLRDVYSPASPNYRKFLTPAQFADRYGPAKQDYRALITYAQAHGFKVVGTHSNRTILDVEGAVSDIEKTFNVRMHTYQHPTEARQFYAPDTDPTTDAPVTLMRISGLDNYALPRPNLKVKGAAGNATANAKGNAGSGPGGTYAGYDFRAAYAPQTSLQGYGQTVGLLEFDGYSSNDISYYENLEGLPNVPLVNVLLDGAIG
jgi:subtilase family serine protease